MTNDEVDREVQKIAQQSREPIATVRKRLTENEERWTGLLRISRREKAADFLFDKAGRKRSRLLNLCLRLTRHNRGMAEKTYLPTACASLFVFCAG